MNADVYRDAIGSAGKAGNMAARRIADGQGRAVITAQVPLHRVGSAEARQPELGPALPDAGPAAPETRRLYAGDRAAFSGWCVRHGEAPLPAVPATVAAYLQTIVGRLGIGALVRRVAAINDRHRSHGHPAPGAAALAGAAGPHGRPLLG